MTRFAIAFSALILCGGTAHASCALSLSPCSTDSRGNTYRTEQNLGGGYSTTRNGMPYSTTNQNLSGGYTEQFNSGGTRTYNYDPNANARRNPYGYR